MMAFFSFRQSIIIESGYEQRADMNSLIIEPIALANKNGQVTRSCHIVRIDNGIEVDRQILWFQFPETIDSPDAEDCDSYLLCILMDALTEAREIQIKGSVSLSLLSNLTEFQRAWHTLRQDLYSVVDITVDEIRKEIAEVEGAVCAFSGGVDSMFTAWQHSQKKNSYRTQTINFCSLVHGFDIPLEDTEAFSEAFSRSESVLDDINIPLIPIKTNYREMTQAKWDYAHAIALVGVLSNFKKKAGIILLGSTYPYSNLFTPWGSSPATDNLLGSNHFHVIHDGAAYTRTEKVNAIADWQVGIKYLRVCWQGAKKDRNCGCCEKCVRTQFNFLACGRDIPSCFPADTNLIACLKTFTLNTSGLRGAWQQIYDYALASGIGESWRKEIIRLIRRSQPGLFSFSKKGYVRKKLRARRKMKKQRAVSAK